MESVETWPELALWHSRRRITCLFASVAGWRGLLFSIPVLQACARARRYLCWLLADTLRPFPYQ
jgi:hypothetical protein